MFLKFLKEKKNNLMNFINKIYIKYKFLFFKVKLNNFYKKTIEN